MAPGNTMGNIPAKVPTIAPALSPAQENPRKIGHTKPATFVRKKGSANHNNVVVQGRMEVENSAEPEGVT